MPGGYDWRSQLPIQGPLFRLTNMHVWVKDVFPFAQFSQSSVLVLQQSRENSQPQSQENSKQGALDRAEAAEKLRSIQSEGGRPRMTTMNSPRSKLQDIAEKGQSSSAESMAASQASSSRQATEIRLSFSTSQYRALPVQTFSVQCCHQQNSGLQSSASCLIIHTQLSSQPTA